MRFADLKSALERTYRDLDGNHTLQMAAALSYYFVLSLFPFGVDASPSATLHSIVTLACIIVSRRGCYWGDY